MTMPGAEPVVVAAISTGVGVGMKFEAAARHPVEVGVAVGVFVVVGVSVAVEVPVCVGEEVEVVVGVRVAVRVEVRVGVREGVDVSVGVAVGDGVNVHVFVGSFGVFVTLGAGVLVQGSLPHSPP
jgi:NF-X1-type zinc finger protein NFXL1